MAGPGGGGGSEGFYRSTDSGHTWVNPVVNKFTDGPGFPKTLIACDTALLGGGYRSTNYGVHWVEMSINGTAFAVSGDTVVAAPGIYISTDQGLNWTGRSLDRANSVAFLGSILFAGTTTGSIYRSTNLGISWDSVIGGLSSINAFAVSGSNIFAGTGGGGVYLSIDSGKSWMAENTGLANMNVTCFAIIDSFLIAGTSGYNPEPDGSFHRSIAEMAAKSAVAELPSALDSVMVYPNPTTGTVTIESRKPIISLEVMSILGVDILQVPTAGRASLTLDLSSETSGTYYIRVQTDGRTFLKQVIIDR